MLAFLLSLLFLNFTLMMEKLLRLSRLLSGVGASMGDVGKIVLCIQPPLLILTIPMAMLLATLVTYGRMNADSELTILRGSGMSFRAISLPVLYLGVACFFLSISMSFYLGPMGSAMLRATISEILTLKAPMTIEEGIFNTSFKDIVILVKNKPAPNRLSDIFIMDDRKEDEQKVITAREGIIAPSEDALRFSLTDGHIYMTRKKVLTEIRFGGYHFRLNPSVEPPVRKNSEFTPAELLKQVREKKDRRVPLLLEFYRRLSMPAICLIIILLGTALSLMSGKSGRIGGLTVGFLIFALYYTLLLYGENLARTGRLPVFAGAWLPFTILGIFSVLVFEKVNRR